MGGYVDDISMSVSESATQGVQLGSFRNGGRGTDWAWLALPVVVLGIAWLWFKNK